MKKIWFGVIGIVLIGLDQLFRWRAGDWFSAEKNRGIIFGLGENWPVSLIILASVFLILLLVWQFIKESRFLVQSGLIFIIAGGLSNLLSRVFFGYIVDFIKLGFWPAFNMADIFIVIGVVIYGYSFLMDRKQN